MPELKNLHSIQTPSAKVLAVALNADASRCACGDRDGYIYIVDTASGQILRKLGRHIEFVYCLAFDKKNGHLISAGKDKSIREWNIESGAFLKDYAQIFTSAGAQTMASQCLKPTTRSHSMTILSVALADGGLMGTGSQDSKVKLWKFGEPIRTFDWHSKPVTCVRFEPEVNVLFSASRDKDIRSWNADNGALIHRYSGHLGEIVGMEFIDVHTFVSVDAVGQILIWNTDIERPIGEIGQASGRAVCAALLRSRNMLLVGLENGVIEAFDISFDDTPEKREAVCSASQHTSEIRCISAADEGNLFASSDNSGKVVLWNFHD